MASRASRRARSPARRARARHRGDSPDECDVPAAVASASSTRDDGVVYLPDGVRAARVDAREPVARGAGAHAHCVVSAKLARAVGARAGAWVELRSYARREDENDGATLATPTRGRKNAKAVDAGDARAATRAVIVEDGDARATRATTHAAAARRALRLDVDADRDEDDDDEARGARVVLARAWPTSGLGDDGVSLSRKVWLSMGCPSGGTILGAQTRRDAAGPIDAFEAEGEIVAHLKLWALELDVGGEAAVWLERGLRAGGGGRTAARQRGILEALARRALDGRGLLVGNLVRLPLLGTSALFKVIRLEPDVGDRGVEISTRTRIVLYPREEGGDDASSSARASESDDDDDVVAFAVKRASRAAMSQDVSFDSLGGVGDHEAALRELVTLPLESPEVFTRCGVKPPRGVLLYGPPGSGKTRLARAAAQASNAKLFVVNGPELVSAHMGESEEALRGVFLAAVKAAPSVVLLDELDAIAPARNQSSGGDDMMSSRIVATMLAIFDGTSSNVPELDRVVVIATTNRPDAIERSLRRPGRFDRELEVGVPTPSDRLEILQTHLRGLNHDLTEEYIVDLARRAHGFVGADIASLCQNAAMRALTRVIEKTSGRSSGVSDDVDGVARAIGDIDISSRDERVIMEDFEHARVKVRPSALREVAIEVPNVAWDDVGGLDEVKDRLKEAVEWAEKHPDAMKRVGASPPKGILLYGPPGCSKTMLARAVASASGRNFISIKGSELFSKWVGDSEKAVRAVFSRARASAPSVIFIDEVDGLAGTRGGGEQGGAPSVQDRVITQLLGEMDGLSSTANVTVVAATNRPDLVDGALLRPGRFDRLLYVPPPQSSEDRMAILRVQFKNTPLADDVDLSLAAMSTQGYTGADLSAISREAALAALEESIDADRVFARHVATAMTRVRPSPPPHQELLDMYQKFQRT